MLGLGRSTQACKGMGDVFGKGAWRWLSSPSGAPSGKMESGVIVFGAHPDDPEVGCDGLVAKE